MQIKLTKRQSEALRHRLDVSDALADVFEDEHDRSDVEHVCDLLLSGLTTGAIVTAAADSFSPVLTRKVIRDCIEGSTWIAVNDCDAPDDKRAAGAYRTLEGLAEAVRDYIGHECRIPVG